MFKPQTPTLMLKKNKEKTNIWKIMKVSKYLNLQKKVAFKIKSFITIIYQDLNLNFKKDKNSSNQTK